MRGNLDQILTNATSSQQSGADAGTYKSSPVLRQLRRGANARLTRDFNTLSRKGPQELKSFENIANLAASLALSENVDDRAQAAWLFHDYAPQLKEFYELQAPRRPGKNGKPGDPLTYEELAEMAGDVPDTRPAWMRTLGPIASGLEYLDNIGQGVMHGIAGLRQGDFKYAGSSFGQGLIKAATPGFDSVLGVDVPFETDSFNRRWRIDENGRRVSPAGTDISSGPGLKGMREAFGIDESANSGLGWDLWDLGLRIGLDPTSYIGVGIAGKAGTQAARRPISILRKATASGGDDLADRILKKGLGSLSPAELDTTRAIMRQAADASARPAGMLRRARSADDITDNLMGVLQRQGRQGVKFGGRTVIPTPRLASALESGTDALRGSKLGTAARRAFVPRSKVQDLFGRGARSAVGDAQAHSRAVATREGMEFTERFINPFNRFAKQYGDEQVNEWMNVVHRHLVQSKKPATPAARKALAEVPGEIREFSLNLADYMKRTSQTTEAASPSMMRMPALRSLDEAIRTGGEEGQMLADAVRRWGASPGRDAGPLAGVITRGSEAAHVSKRVLDPVDAIRSGARQQYSRVDPFDRLRGKTDPLAPDHDLWARQTGRSISEDLERHVDAIMGEGTLARMAPDMTADAGGLFGDDMLTAAAVRDAAYRQELTNGIMYSDLYRASSKGLAKVDGEDVLPLVIKERNPLFKKHKGYYTKKVTGIDPNTLERSTYWTSEELHEAIHGPAKLMKDEEGLEFLKKGFAAWNQTWAGWATVPVVAGDAGFHARNMFGNMYNMALAGVRDPGVFLRAGNIQRKLKQAKQVMRKESVSFEEAARKVAGSTAEYDLMDSVWHNLAPGGMSHDITMDDFLAEGARIGERSGASKFNPFNPRNYAIRSGGRLGTAIEDNARIALYIDGLDKGMRKSEARDRVYTFLFDYADLTGFEHGVRRYLNRFYTFTRKNAPLQIRTLAQTPGRQLAAVRITDFWQEQMASAFGLRDQGELGPNATFVPWQVSLFNGSRAHWNAKYATGIETPLEQFGQIFASTVGAAAWIPQVRSLMDRIGLSNVVSPEGEEFSNLQDTMTSGPLAGLFEFAYDESVGRNSFTGRPLSPSLWGWDGKLARYVNVVAPMVHDLEMAVMAGQGEFQTAGTRGVSLGDGKYTRGAQGTDLLHLELLNRLGGMQVLWYGDPKYSEAAANALNGALERAVLEGDLQPPTIDELEEEGIYRFTDNVRLGLLYQLNAGPGGSAEAMRAWEEIPVETLRMIDDELGLNLEMLIGDLQKIHRTTDESDPNAELEMWNRQIDAVRRSIEAQGREFTDDMRKELAIRLVDPTVAEAEAAGYSRGPNRASGGNTWDKRAEYAAEKAAWEAENPGKVYEDYEEDIEVRADREEGERKGDQIAALLGLDGWEELVKDSPWQSYLEYQLNQAEIAEKFVPQSELIQYFYDDLTQEAKANLFGPEVLGDKSWQEMTEKEKQEDAERIARNWTDLQTAVMVFGYDPAEWRMQLLDIAINEVMTIQEQYGSRGYREPKVPRTESRPDEVAQRHGGDIMSYLLQEQENPQEILSYFSSNAG